jgi:hypothetical protein
MYYLIEDPSYVLIALGLMALGFLLALKVTQQGKYLVWAGGLLGLAAAIFGFEQYWVTDAERVETVVYDLARAVEASDVDRIKSHLDDRVTVGMRDRTIDGSIPMRLVFPLLRRTHFDFVRVSQLATSAGRQTKLGKAEFKVSATGTLDESGSPVPLATTGTEWSLGFREASPGVWKVTRITAIRVPGQVARALFGR